VPDVERLIFEEAHAVIGDGGYDGDDDSYDCDSYDCDGYDASSGYDGYGDGDGDGNGDGDGDGY